MVDQPDPAQGQLVLGAPAAPTGASRRPAVTAEASCHGDQPPTTAVVAPRRRRAAAPTRPIASTASPTPVLAAADGDDDGAIHGDDVNRAFRAAFVGVVAR